MTLSLSTAVAPDLGLDELAAACRARGLEGLEHVVDASSPWAERAVALRASGTRVVALRTELLDARSAEALATLSAELGVPVSVALGCATGELGAIAQAFERKGGRLLLGHGTKLDEVLDRLAAIAALGAPPSIGLAWDLRPSTERLDEASAVLLAARERLGLVRLHGGGPEQRAQDGLGIGPLLVELALTAYAGPIVMCPSAAAELPRWRQWLASQKGVASGHARGDRGIDVDVRDVEPRDRMELILGAYRALVPNATLRLTLDHDPICMFHTLTATEPTGSFHFGAVDHGPEVWRAEITRL